MFVTDLIAGPTRDGEQTMSKGVVKILPKHAWPTQVYGIGFNSGRIVEILGIWIMWEGMDDWAFQLTDTYIDGGTHHRRRQVYVIAKRNVYDKIAAF